MEKGKGKLERGTIKGAEAGPVLRLRVEWSGGTCRLIKRMSIPLKRLPAAETKIDPEVHPRGFFVEGIDAEGKTIYRRAMVNPFRRGAEVFDSGGRIHAVDHMRDSVQFDVLVPDLRKIQSVRLTANPHPFHPKPGAKESATVEIASFVVREDERPARKDRRHEQD